MKYELLFSLWESNRPLMGWLRENNDYDDYDDEYDSSPRYPIRRRPTKPQSGWRKAAKAGAVVGGGALALGALGGIVKRHNWRSKVKNSGDWVKNVKAMADGPAKDKALKKVANHIGYPRAWLRGAKEGIKSPIAHMKYLGGRVYKSTIGAWDD